MTWDDEPGDEVANALRAEIRADARAASQQKATRQTGGTNCVNCGKPEKPLRRGRCYTCWRYLRVYGKDRAAELFANRDRGLTQNC
jgi:hypothetical protein